MKAKFLLASILLASLTVAGNAQEAKKNYYTKKASDNLFVGFGVGGMSVLNDGFNTPTLNFNIQFGKYITPVWGVRGVVSGISQSLDNQNNSYFVSGASQYHKYCKKFGEVNLDAMLNLINLFGGYNPDRAFNLYLFGGPTANYSSKGTSFTNATTATDEYLLETNGDKKIRFGATAGLGLSYDINAKWAINLEGRVGVTPSIFGDASDCRKAEATARLNLGVAYTFGGKKFARVSNVDEDALNAEINKYRSELAQAQADLANAKNALANVKPETKEVVKEVQVAGPRAIFFKIGSAKIDDYGKVNIELAAKVLKANSDKKYKIAGYADKATGSASWNQKLSEKRAQAVYDALIAQGVDKDQLELVGFGGTENMFGKNFLNRVVILE
ncbi:OmpA family protein [Bacteroides helcogenes]|uniref:OmpA/MotB domain protein n=1 Tax=Bacteroides helcogenes (strain ATCC 35417 / DSM 20613 / JCM 6297 / CCUG 15421 / P 36-108) TaxID=693979 RepID=E6SNQ0_BACT6|nr:OmpA family protein [Bacteroides helcogenes]ADV44783.1 OmpA/MotB domain protein [Bacteroides helcogenes P 36-108]MDY5239993.1 OmpA family protein [Bacteroides helcogenes]